MSVITNNKNITKNIFYIPVEGVGYDMLWGFIEAGIEVKTYPKSVPVGEYEELILEELMKWIDEGVVASQRFSAVVAEACHMKQCVYLSWCWDSPQKELFLNEAKYDTNNVFVFDKVQLERMKRFGLKNVYYEPLATNVTRASSVVIKDEDIVKFGHAVSFVGNLRYNKNRNIFFERMQGFTGEYVRSYIKQNIGRWNNTDKIYEKISDEVIESICEHIDVSGRVDRCVPIEYMAKTMIADEISYFDRVGMLNTMAKEYETALYTEDGILNSDLDEAVSVLPKVSYDEEMLKVFYSSKINLNITKRSIESGVPLRVFDILSVGGFALTNDGDEINELFEVGKELETYKSIDEAVEKASFYLKNESLRIRLAINGYKKVKQEYSYPQAVVRMLEKCCE